MLLAELDLLVGLGWGGMGWGGGGGGGGGGGLSHNSVLRVIQPHCHSGLPAFSAQTTFGNKTGKFLFASIYPEYNDK